MKTQRLSLCLISDRQYLGPESKQVDEVVLLFYVVFTYLGLNVTSVAKILSFDIRNS